MNRPTTPLGYAQAACETMMRKFSPQDLPPKGHFHYHQGVFLSGVMKTYGLCREERYFDYVKAWVNSVVMEDGSIPSIHPGWLDDFQPGILLFPLLDRTGAEKYRRALDLVARYVMEMPRNQVGGLWHKDILPNQMWLDGLYMEGPFCAQYGRHFDKPEYLRLVVEQAQLMEAHTRDEKTGLWRHAWDASRQQAWADPKTGLSQEFWGRSMGWVPVALLDDMDFMDPDEAGYEILRKMVVRLLNTVLTYQSSEGRWYQVLNKVTVPGNWPENSCSCLFVAAISKAVRKGLLPPGCLDAARRAYDAIITSLDWEGENLLVGHVCIGTNVGDYDYYCQRPVSQNDLHGVGAFLLMCTELAQADMAYPAK